MTDQPTMGPRYSGAWVDVLAWCIRHWFLVLVLVALLWGAISAIIPNESDHPRSGYSPSGRQVTEQECRDEGGQVVGDVCYAP